MLEPVYPLSVFEIGTLTLEQICGLVLFVRGDISGHKTLNTEQ